MTVRTLVVWCPDWQVRAAGFDAVDRVAVVHANRVVACSAAARGDGVVCGLRRRQAEARCAGLVVVDHDPGRDARAFEPIVLAVESFTPRVEIVRPGVCAFATRGPSRYFGGDDALAAKVRATVPVACSVGIADGPFAAEVAARGDVCVPPGKSAAFLAPFPVSLLRRPELADLLVRLGIRTLGGLSDLPATAVLARFGPDGAVVHRLARGLDDGVPAGRPPPPDLVVTSELDPPATRVDTAAFVAKALAEELHAQLARQGLACARVQIEAETEHGEHLCRLWRHDGGLSPAALAERVRWQLDGWLTAGGADGPTAGLTLLRLVPDGVVPDDGRQIGFWGGDSTGDERVARCLARVQGMLGVDSVVTAVPVGGRHPAEQARLVPWGDDRTRSDRGSEPPWPGRIPPPAPATVHLTPVPAEVLVTGGAPTRLSVAGGRWADIERWAGPWPVDERWWDPPAARRRSRWQVLTTCGAAYLLSAEGGRWSVEATYD